MLIRPLQYVDGAGDWAWRAVWAGLFICCLVIAMWVVASDKEVLSRGGVRGVLIGSSERSTIPVPVAPRELNPSAEVIIAFLAAQARNLQLEWVSSVTTQSAKSSAIPIYELAPWQAQVSLTGSYPAVKRWMREATARYPNIAWTSARWVRSVAVPSPTVIGRDPSSERMDVQLQLSWLKHAPGAEPAASAVGFSGS